MTAVSSTHVAAAAALMAALAAGAPPQASAQASSPASSSRVPSSAPASAGRVETRHVVVTTSVKAEGVRVELVVDVEPKPKMHVYAPEQKDVIPVALTLSDAGISAAPVQYPRAEKYFFEPLKETQLVYSKPFRLRQAITLASETAAPRTVTGRLRYQACDQTVCYLPQTVTLSWIIPGK